MNNLEKWLKNTATAETVWLYITSTESRSPCEICPAEERCKESKQCCRMSFLEWANADK